MPKSHVVKLTIKNNSGHPMALKKGSEWFDSGRIADRWNWPETISDGTKEIIECYEKNNALWAGCSGYVVYHLDGHELTISFSNPAFAAGKNKIGIGTGDSKHVWEGMDSHGYETFEENLTINNKKYKAVCRATDGDVNEAEVNIIAV